MIKQGFKALLVSVCFTGVIAASAQANDRSRLFDDDVIYDAPPRTHHVRPDTRRPELGGGLIEFIFTGDAQSSRPHSARSYDAQDYGQRRPIVRQFDASTGNQEDYLTESPVRRAVDPRYEKQAVAYDGREPAGTIIIDTPNKFLFLVQSDGRAIRYGVGVGKPGFTWAGVKKITAKKEWPSWVPPKAMLVRRPDLPRFMEGGPDNPLGARALYLGTSLYRIHGSNEPWTIGTNVSSGCIRMRNEDVIDLYGRVGVGARVVVI